jgi:hypothetical protein
MTGHRSRPGGRQRPAGSPTGQPGAPGAPAGSITPEADPDGFVCLPVGLLRTIEKFLGRRPAGYWRWQETGAVTNRPPPEEPR